MWGPGIKTVHIGVHVYNVPFRLDGVFESPEHGENLVRPPPPAQDPHVTIVRCGFCRQPLRAVREVSGNMYCYSRSNMTMHIPSSTLYFTV